jgi:hypothetical protein
MEGMSELHIDIKKHMDETLKASCQSLKYSAVQYLLGPLETFLAKVTAFLGLLLLLLFLPSFLLLLLFLLSPSPQEVRFQSIGVGEAQEVAVVAVQMKALSLVRKQQFLSLFERI